MKKLEMVEMFVKEYKQDSSKDIYDNWNDFNIKLLNDGVISKSEIKTAYNLPALIKKVGA